MRLDRFSRILFVIYCVEAGAVLLLVPWGGGWERMAIQIPLAALRDLLLHPVARSTVSAFGLLHLVWAVHDTVLLLSSRRSHERPSA